MEVPFLRVRKGHFHFLMWPFPHCQKWHFQCPKQKTKTTSIDHVYPQVVGKIPSYMKFFSKSPNGLISKFGILKVLWDVEKVFKVPQ